MKGILKSGTIILLIILAVACKKDEDAEPELEYNTANLLTRNFLTYDGSLDFLIDDLKVTDDVAYSFGSNSEFQWVKGETTVIHSINLNGDGNELFSTDLDVEADGSYLSAVIGPISDGKVILTKNDQTEPEAGNIRLRFLHAYQGEGGIDVYVGGTEASHKLVTNLGYANLSTYYELATVDINASFILTKTGIAPDPSTNLITSIDNNGHQAGNIYMAVFASQTIDPTTNLRWYIIPEN